MPTKHFIDRSYEELERVRKRMIKFLAALPENIKQNPEITPVGRKMFTAKFSDIRQQNNWRPEYHDFKVSAYLLLSYLCSTDTKYLDIDDGKAARSRITKYLTLTMQADPEAIIRRLNGVLKTGKIGLGRCNILKFHPEFMKQLRTYLTGGT